MDEPMTDGLLMQRLADYHILRRMLAKVDIGLYEGGNNTYLATDYNCSNEPLSEIELAVWVRVQALNKQEGLA